MKKSAIYFLNLILVLGLCSCASGPRVTPLVDVTIIEDVRVNFPVLDSELFGQELEVETESQILDLSESQLIHFLAYYNSREQLKKPGHERLYSYLQNIGDDFVYESNTNNAEVTLQTKSGNCLSLAVLTTALARAANIEIKYQLVNRVPIYQEFGNIIFNAQHIRSVIYAPDSEMLKGAQAGFQVSRRKAVIDYFPSRYTYVDKRINETEFLASYYRNLAAEALAIDDFSQAFWLLKESLAVEPENAEAINSLAVLHRRIGDVDKAEELYKYGIKHAANKIALLRNYHILLTQLERYADAEKVENELDGLDDINPFSWLHAANEAYEQNDYVDALKLYRKAIDIAPYLHQGYFGIAKVEYAKGNLSLANTALERAKEEAFDGKSKSLYDAKLSALSRERYN